VVSALSMDGTLHVILRSRQKRQPITGLCHTLCFVDGNFNTPCPALGTRVSVGSDDVDVAVLSMRATLDIGVPVSEDENDDERRGTRRIRVRTRN